MLYEALASQAPLEGPELYNINGMPIPIAIAPAGCVIGTPQRSEHDIPAHEFLDVEDCDTVRMLLMLRSLSSREPPGTTNNARWASAIGELLHHDERLLPQYRYSVAAPNRCPYWPVITTPEMFRSVAVLEQAGAAAALAALSAGASQDIAAEVAGVVVGDAVIASGGSKEEAGRAAGRVTRQNGGSVQAQASAAGAVVARGGGSAEEAVAAAVHVASREESVTDFMRSLSAASVHLADVPHDLTLLDPGRNRYKSPHRGSIDLHSVKGNLEYVPSTESPTSPTLPSRLPDTRIVGQATIQPFQKYQYVVNQPPPSWNLNWAVVNGAVVSGQGTTVATVMWDGFGSGVVTVCFSSGVHQRQGLLEVAQEVAQDVTRTQSAPPLKFSSRESHSLEPSSVTSAGIAVGHHRQKRIEVKAACDQSQSQAPTPATNTLKQNSSEEEAQGEKPPRYPRHPGRDSCVGYMKTGVCVRSDQGMICKFDHPQRCSTQQDSEKTRADSQDAPLELKGTEVKSEKSEGQTAHGIASTLGSKTTAAERLKRAKQDLKIAQRSKKKGVHLS